MAQILAAAGNPSSRRLPRPLAGAPFVLADDVDADRALLFRTPRQIIVAETSADVAPALAETEAALADGMTAAGYLAYEAAAGIDARWPAARPSGWPLLWFGLFDAPETIDAVAATLPAADEARVGPPVPLIARAEHEAAVARILQLIAAGDIYQANLTFGCMVEWAGDPLALYARLRAASRAPHGGIVDLGGRALLSASPELFFALKGGQLVARPMKGTARRTGDPVADLLAAARLRESIKERAENLMITDLLRNDLSRVAVPGSVAVPALFDVETYPTVLQMTSTVTARLQPRLGPVDVLRAAFPCGSVTGAPKLRASEVIAEVERAPRGPYTGGIGWMRRDAARFNVAIRTLELSPGGTARLGLGSGIVADSVAAAEWDECLAKGAFLA